MCQFLVMLMDDGRFPDNVVISAVVHRGALLFGSCLNQN